MSQPKKLTFPEIQEKLKSKDILFTDIAVALEVTVSHVTQIAKCKGKSKRVAEAIANALKLPLNQVFGTDYMPAFSGRSARRNEVVKAIRAGRHVPDPISMSAKAG
ncbi:MULTISPECIES: hypothetical protein [Pseudoalteromonas]|uniref:HTH cro/C1-type domain-containing protein n=1 Tax=Pseudoalteromonas amylolytica TaxID=1859457 RepID=A0A1S1MSZ5_9GAMM|nr:MULTISPECIES: hypothetical protein [Pseudoalteromonas]OHU85508.1 hypothetical protein BFC16_19360 [Pseudoalteromonas sp. JW3]OHU91742.1 hypothetical protein BET10_08055 [Pseudoalteromonas amylolytica]